MSAKLDSKPDLFGFAGWNRVGYVVEEIGKDGSDSRRQAPIVMRKCILL
jgi:hypothetical protein